MVKNGSTIPETTRRVPKQPNGSAPVQYQVLQIDSDGKYVFDWVHFKVP